MPIDKSELVDFANAAREFGQEVDNFLIEKIKEGFSPTSLGVDSHNGLLKITMRSTGVSKTYPCGNGSSWPASFRHDLAAGVFSVK